MIEIVFLAHITQDVSMTYNVRRLKERTKRASKNKRFKLKRMVSLSQLNCKSESIEHTRIEQDPLTDLKILFWDMISNRLNVNCISVTVIVHFSV